MAQRPIEQLTFREKIRDCAHKGRELIEHLDQNLIPHAHELRKRTRPPKPGQEDEVTDLTVRTLVASVLESQAYAEQIETQVEAYGAAIETELAAILKTPAL